MIDLNVGNGYIKIGQVEHLLTSKHGLRINQLIVEDQLVYVLCMANEEDENYEHLLKKDNVFVFNYQGDSIWTSGAFEFEYPVGKTIKIPTSFMEIKGDTIKFYYQSNHEVTVNKFTGEVLKTEFILKY